MSSARGSAARRHGGGGGWRAAALLLASCQQWLGIEALHEQRRPGSTAEVADAAVAPGQSTAGDGGAPPSEPQPACRAAPPGTECFTSLGAAGLCDASETCVEYCILDHSRIEQCLLF